MKFLFDVWPMVEKVGIPLLLVPFGLAFLSLNTYLSQCKVLYLMERDIKFHGSLIGRKYSSLQVIGVNAIHFGLKSHSNYSDTFLKHRRFKSQIEMIRGYRKMYVVVFPTILIIGTIGMIINEWVIDA